MKKICELTEAELITLQSAYKNHPSARVRSRALMIILNSKGYSLKKIADICQMTRQTVSAVTDAWNRDGLRGLYDNPRPGRPCALTPEDEAFVQKMAEADPHSVKKIMTALETARGKKVSRSTVKRAIKKNR
jgi:transposase